MRARPLYATRMTLGEAMASVGSGVRREDFFEESADAGPWGARQRVLNDALLENVFAGVDARSDVEVAVPLAHLVHDEYELFGTDGTEEFTNTQARGAMAALRATLRRLDVPFEPPFSDFTDFR